MLDVRCLADVQLAIIANLRLTVSTLNVLWHASDVWLFPACRRSERWLLTGAECLNVSDLEFMDVDIDTTVSCSLFSHLKNLLKTPLETLPSFFDGGI